MPLPRRTFLKGIGAAAATTAAACRKDGDSDVGPGGIDTIVLVMMENRSFDHILGALTLEEGRNDVDGLLPTMTNPHPDGRIVAPYPMDVFCQPDPPHGWGSSHDAFTDGTNQGFVEAMVRSNGAEWGDLVMCYHTRAQAPVHFALAEGYAVSQKWFSSVMGPTWPNRLYFHGAQSEGKIDNSLPETTFFEMMTIWDQLDEAGIEWAYYYTDLPMLALFGRFAGRLKTVDQFYVDAAEGRLPRVVCVEPGAGLNDDHPPHHTLLGQVFISSIHNALATSPHWNRCMGIVTYDEAGGFFDHVPPPKTADDRAAEGFDQLGFRVPAYAFGPYVKRGWVSDVQRDHASALSEVQRQLGLEPLNARNAAAADLSDCLDLDRMEANEPLEPVELPLIELTTEEIQAQCAPDRRRTGWPELSEMLAAKRLSHLDRTDEKPRLMADFIETAQRLGACVVR
jgi:phospholipase C